MAITIVILFASLAILGWQYVGCGETIGGALGIDPKIAMLLVGVVVTAYVVFGGHLGGYRHRCDSVLLGIHYPVHHPADLFDREVRVA